MLEDRLDERFQGEYREDEATGPVRISDMWRQGRRHEEADTFDKIAEMIESGSLKIKGAKKGDVVERLRTKAEGRRSGS